MERPQSHSTHANNFLHCSKEINGKVVRFPVQSAWTKSEWRNGLADQQLEAFDLAHEWFFNQPDHPFMVTGWAGTGKSFCVQRIVRSIRELWQGDRKLRIALAAPTHKARAVLDSFAQAAGLKDVHIATLHSLLHVMPGKSDENGIIRLQVNSYSTEPHYLEFGLVVIDEASMISEELLSFIPRQIPTIFMGDPAQLPPVEREQDGDPRDSPVFTLPCGINLTQVMRYEGMIANYATAIRQDISSQFSPRVQTLGNLTKIRDKSEWEQAVIDAFGQVDLKEHPNDVRVLAWTNKRIAELNKLIRNTFFDSEQEFCTGERLMAKEPIIRSEGGNKKRILMQTCAEATIEWVKAGTGKIRLGETLEFDTWHLELLTDLGEAIEVTTVAQSSWHPVKRLIADYKKSILECSLRSERRQMWQDYYQVLEHLSLVVKGNTLLHRLQYAFALTIHQSQGSTFNHVFVDQSNVWGCQHPKTRNQLLYVSATRASEHLTIYSKV